ncbi:MULTISPECIES: glycosyltransferase N-terminal domain-containing protein [Acidobacterium]|uniref:3-deoxy-D-manno-octulosonic acid transferase n=1 Tax=Acidobacterium capsulatum (strain ATCC 51196 / DSM 11244 / BCRC 80197 / JCM 7670 / NBRC 15755 / NCIMB 13165 / 161) TaxID=240015 RepID=C1F754_ACIC5|nr:MULTISPECIES: glycosyltransferase N-terminal domain-containing protein [Acidobacterium]ACO32559.1 3-deoxy-D-manno-octulosonic-acid transferase [Acidobacterium capsulatum ATCC 51196]
MLLALYSLALLLVLVVGAPFWLVRMATAGKYREGLWQRLGLVPRALREAVAGKRVIWVHAVSVGEVLAASRLILTLRERSGCTVVVSTTTRTGQRLARERFGSALGAETVFYFPLDFAFAVRAYLRVLRPRMVVLLETEFWPRLLTECRRSEIPVCVVNARISDRSWPRYHRLRFLWRHLLAHFAAVLAQSELDAERLRALGAANAQAAGNLKYDISPQQRAPVAGDSAARTPATAVELVRQHLPPQVPVLVCGSTCGQGSESEERLLLAALPSDVVTILAPRHPERFEAVAQMLDHSGRAWHRRSAWAAQPVPLVPGSVLLLDSIGELASLYALATVAFVGGSLLPLGGHNPLEPAQFAVPVVMGEHYANFRGVVAALESENALRLTSPSALGSTFAGLLAHPEQARAMGERARMVCEREAGATERAVKTLLAVLEKEREGAR